MHYVTAVIAAGGSGRRMQLPGNKVYVPLLGKPVLSRTVEIFDCYRGITEIVVVVPHKEIESCRSVIEPFCRNTPVKVVAGGKERQDSVFCGILAASGNCEYVVVHDGARPLLTSALLEAVLREAMVHDAAIAAVPLKDTVKIADARGFVVDTPDRDSLWSVQTPQVFKKEVLAAAHEWAQGKGILGTDDASLVEKLGHQVKIVPGDYENIKITTPEDINIAEAILLKRRDRDAGGNRL